MKKSCKCEKCLSCCQWAPGWPTPEEAQKAIDAGFATKLMRDWWEPDTDFIERVYLLCPAVHGHESDDAPNGSFWSGKGICSLLENNLCTIHESGFKPTECRMAFGCQNGSDSNETRLKIVHAWNTPEGRAIVSNWERLVA